MGISEIESLGRARLGLLYILARLIANYFSYVKIGNYLTMVGSQKRVRRNLTESDEKRRKTAGNRQQV